MEVDTALARRGVQSGGDLHGGLSQSSQERWGWLERLGGIIGLDRDLDTGKGVDQWVRALPSTDSTPSETGKFSVLGRSSGAVG